MAHGNSCNRLLPLSIGAWRYLNAAFLRTYVLDPEAPTCPLCGREQNVQTVDPWWFDIKWDDPTSDHYQPHRRWHPILRKYICPARGCRKRFRHERKLSVHLLEVHVKCSSYCPGCFKRPHHYSSAAGPEKGGKVDPMPFGGESKQ